MTNYQAESTDVDNMSFDELKEALIHRLEHVNTVEALYEEADNRFQALKLICWEHGIDVPDGLGE